MRWRQPVLAACILVGVAAGPTLAQTSEFSIVSVALGIARHHAGPCRHAGAMAAAARDAAHGQ